MLSYVEFLPIHPQWIMRSSGPLSREIIELLEDKSILDIGCGEQKIRQILPQNSYYCGLDYYDTATQWYFTQPDIFGDAQVLPFKSNSFDFVFLFDVLEHIPNTEACLAELHRVLKVDGMCILQIPFMYPIHDAPLDFYRWTNFGLKELTSNNKFRIENITGIGTSVETSILLLNIALSKTLLKLLQSFNPIAVLGLFLPIWIFLSNIFAFISKFIVKDYDFMPFKYSLFLSKIETIE